MEETRNTTTEQRDQKHFGPLIGILIIVTVLVFGGLYFWGASLQKATTPGTSNINNESSFETLDATTEEYTMTDEEFNALIGDGSTPTDASLDTALDDLGDLDSLDAELDAFELEL